jgi:hypothetical protein
MRELTYGKAVGERVAHWASLGPMVGLFAVYVNLLERRWPLSSWRSAATIGSAWAGIAAGFELGVGHYVDRKNWSELRASRTSPQAAREVSSSSRPRRCRRLSASGGRAREGRRAAVPRRSLLAAARSRGPLSAPERARLCGGRSAATPTTSTATARTSLAGESAIVPAPSFASRVTGSIPVRSTSWPTSS